MSPDDALKLQIERYRRLTPAERMGIGLQLHDLVCQMSLAGIRQQYPHLGEAEHQQEFVRRLELARR